MNTFTNFSNCTKINVDLRYTYFSFYNSESHMEVLYSSLVKSSLEREDVASMEKENLKNSYEIRQALRNATNAYDSYKWRTSVELIVAIMILFFYAGFSNITGLNDPLFNCNVHGILFKCVIPNSRFYYVSAITDFLYIFATL